MKQFLQKYAPNLTRYAREVLNREITTKTEAEDVAEAVRQSIRAGTYQSAKTFRQTIAAAPVIDGRTVGELAALYDAARVAPDANKRENSKKNDRAHLARLSRAFDGRPMESITIEDLIAFRGSCAELANSSWNKIRTLLGQFFRWAHDAGHIPIDPIAAASADALKLLSRKKARQRRRRISDEEWSNLLEAARETRNEMAGVRLWATLSGLYETGARIGELLALQWADVNLDERTLFIRAEEIGGAKTGESRTIDISEPLYDVLLTLRHDPAGQVQPRRAYVFGNPYGERIKSIDKAFNTAVLRAHRIEPQWVGKGNLTERTRAALDKIDLNAHDIRHEAACRWLESGWFDLAQISKRLGHTTIAQTATYLHAASGSIRQAQHGYDAERKAAQQAQTRKITNKRHTNRKIGPHADLIPRLIKGRNTDS